MSKKSTPLQSNTILNYFLTPKSNKKAEQTTPLSKPAPSNEEDDDDLVRVKRRKRLDLSDSETEEVENESPGPGTSRKRSKIKRILSDDDSDSSGETKRPVKKLQKYSKTDFSSSQKSDNAAATFSDSDTETTAAPSNGGAKPKAAEPTPHAKPNLFSHTNWAHNTFEFLKPNNICDDKMRRPEDPDYDHRTLYVPVAFLNQQTPAMRQWWVLKSTHMDCVIFFKVGRFYELYHMDAVVGVQHCDLTYMKGDFAHCGFPEQAYGHIASNLLAKGFKIARTEQTETPEMMAERIKASTKKTTKFDKVVDREICQISTRSTCIYNAQLSKPVHTLPYYLYAISEGDQTASSRTIGICFVDTSTGQFYLSQFQDDAIFSKLLTICSQFVPGTFLMERHKVSKALKTLVSTYFRSVKQEFLTPKSQFYTSDQTIEKLINSDYYRDENSELKLPPVLKDMLDGLIAKKQYELCVKSMGGILWYLENAKIDIQVFSIGKVNKYEVYDHLSDISNAETMVVDSVTINNLNLLGATRPGTLEKTIDRCSTPGGKRLLKQWICRPLCNVDRIRERQEAVLELHENKDLLRDVRLILKKIPDLERQLAKIHNYGNKLLTKDHPDSRAILYENDRYSKRRTNDLLKTIKGFEECSKICGNFELSKCNLLRLITQVTPNGSFPDLWTPLACFNDKFDLKLAHKTGKIMPNPGNDKIYDGTLKQIEKITDEANVYLKNLARQLGCQLSYFGSDKKRFQIEVPDSHTKKLDDTYRLESSKKGAKRYSTKESREFLANMMKTEAERDKRLHELNRIVFEEFCKSKEAWDQAIYCVTILDVLCGFATYGQECSHDITMPKLLRTKENNQIVITNGRHPCIEMPQYVSNDTKLDAESGHILLLTGPNMGGKSTLMRQVGLLVIMAQLGCFIPAERCEMTPINRIFTRIGAHDDIMRSKSTFLVEMSEAASILKYANQNSLVLLDELGRGTSTHDGCALATAFVEKLIEIKCLTLFATHYHSLVSNYAGRSEIQLGHMACLVKDENTMDEKVTFLYKLVEGICPNSYGFNVANLAGLKWSVLKKGREVSKALRETTEAKVLIYEVFANDGLFPEETDDMKHSLRILREKLASIEIGT